MLSPRPGNRGSITTRPVRMRMAMVAARFALCGRRRADQVDRPGVLLSHHRAAALVARMLTHSVGSLTLAQCGSGGCALHRLGDGGRDANRLGNLLGCHAQRGTAAAVAGPSHPPLSLARIGYFPRRVPDRKLAVVG